MQSSTTFQSGWDTSSVSHPNYSSFSRTAITAGYKRISVYDGNVKGDFKRPNPFDLTITHVTPGFLGEQSLFGDMSKLGSRTRRANHPAFDFSDGFNTPVDWPSLNDRCLGKLYEKLRGNSNLAIDLAERHQTIKMLKNMGGIRKIIRSTFRDAKKSRRYQRAKGPNKAAIRADVVASKWLEYRYGWLPFMYSTFDLLEELHRQVFGGLILVKARSRQLTEIDTVTGSGSTSDPYRTVSKFHSARMELGVLFQIPDGKNVWDFTSLNPAGIAYELMTLSFVLDWFVNIGDTLELWENHVIFSRYFQGGYRTDSRLELQTVNSVGLTYRPVSYVPGTIPPLVENKTFTTSFGLNGKRKVISLQRSRLLSLPRPAGFRVRTNLNAKRVADAAALLWGFVRRRQ